MGTTCHVHAEVKINGEWHHYSQGRFLKNYVLFAKMSKEENGVPFLESVDPIAPQRGLPNDISLVTKIAKSTDVHCESWLKAEEIKELEDWWDSQNPRQDIFMLSSKLNWLFGNSFGSFVEHREDYPKEIEDIRWVFWFD